MIAKPFCIELPKALLSPSPATSVFKVWVALAAYS